MVDFVRVLTETPGLCIGCAHYDGAKSYDYGCNLVDGVKVPESENCFAEGGKYVWQVVSEQPKARANDPSTSKAAAKAIKPKVPSLKETIMFLLARNPSGLTGTEIAALSGRRLNSITPRFAELSPVYITTKTTYTPPKGSAAGMYTSETRNGETVWVLA